MALKIFISIVISLLVAVIVSVISVYLKRHSYDKEYTYYMVDDELTVGCLVYDIVEECIGIYCGVHDGDTDYVNVVITEGNSIIHYHCLKDCLINIRQV